MKLPTQSANVRREFSDIRYGAVALPHKEWGVRPSSVGTGGGGTSPPPPPPFCAPDCQVCYDRGQNCELALYCQSMYGINAPYQCYGVRVGGSRPQVIVPHF